MQKLCCVRTIQQPLPVWIIVTSLPTHISINSHPFPMGIVSDPPPFHGFFSHVWDFIIISTIIFNNHVQATLQGKLDMIQFMQGILTICLLIQFDQFFFIGRAIIIERLYSSEKNKIENVGVR